jgi:hypothetical protein
MYYSLLNAALSEEVIGKDEIESVLIDLISNDALFLDFRMADADFNTSTCAESNVVGEDDEDRLRPEEFFEEVKKRRLYRVSEWFYRREDIHDKV